MSSRSVSEAVRPTQPLSPCPFDGGVRLIVTRTRREGYASHQDDADAYAYVVHCATCACEGPWHKSGTSAESAWNRRA